MALFIINGPAKETKGHLSLSQSILFPTLVSFISYRKDTSGIDCDKERTLDDEEL